MRPRLLPLLCLLLAWSISTWGLGNTRGHVPVRPGTAAIDVQARDILATYRQIIVLLADGEVAEQERAAVVGKILYHRNIDRLEKLREELTAEVRHTARSSKTPEKLSRFLDWLERDPELRDADKLAFRELLDELAEVLTSLRQAPAEIVRIAGRIDEDRRALETIQARYEKEVEKIFGQLATRGMALQREAWDDYQRYLKTLYNRERILQEVDPDHRLLPSARGPAAAVLPELNGRELPLKTIVLTFDDGPHGRHTEQILEILDKHKVPAIFFQVGRNLGKVHNKETVLYHQPATLNRRILKSGHLLANHSYSHQVMPKLGSDKLTDEVATTNRLLKLVTNIEPELFRPPYGARDETVLAQIRDSKLRSIMWNIDSLDWADPVPLSITNRVLGLVAAEKRGIILFHDIHAQTVRALPLLLEKLKAEGYRFATWNGKSFAVAGGPAPAVEPAPSTLYRDSWAVIIGIDQYRHWPKLRYAVNDAKAVREVLIAKYRFKPENIYTLYNEQATRGAILALLSDKLASADLVHRNDRVFVFYAGHGATQKLSSGRELGYIIPVDANREGYFGQSISMTNFNDIAEAIPAKHLLFVMDSCYSGLALTRGGAGGGSREYLREIVRRPARQMFTAGGADQQVADSGPNGHSVFTWTLLQGLDGKGDLNGDGIITASELAAYTAPVVSSLSLQTPAFGNMPGSQGGEFVFELRHETEDLSSQSAQLDNQALQLTKRIETLRQEIETKRHRNQRLEQELAAVQAVRAQQQHVPAPSGPSNDPVEAAHHHINQGLLLYKEQKYSEALNAFLAAARIDPANPQATNNAGFVLYKLERHAEALQWLQKTLVIEPRRTVAYLNLGDVYVTLNRPAEARAAYRKYLSLKPPARGAAQVREKLRALEAGAAASR